MTEPSNENKDPIDEPIGTDEELAAALAESSRRLRVRWTIAALVVVALSVAAFLLSAEYREELFRPKPDMAVVEKAAFERSNDPACRAMIEAVDTRQKEWTSLRLSLRGLVEKSDVAEIEKGRAAIGGFIETYAFEARRLDIVVIQDRDTQEESRKWVRTDIRADIAQFYKHALYYLRKMDRLLGERIDTLKGKRQVVEAPGLGEIDVRADKSDPKESYARAWSMVTEDHEKWRVFRQGPLPCGKREGEVPPIPEPEIVGDPIETIKQKYGIKDRPPVQPTGADAGGSDAAGGDAGAGAGADGGPAPGEADAGAPPVKLDEPATPPSSPTTP